MLARPPPRYGVGCWSVVFPVAVYSLAVGELARGTRSEGFRGWAAVCGVLTVALWVGNAACCFWVGVWRGKVLVGAGEETQGCEGRDVEARTAEKAFEGTVERNCRGSGGGSGNDGNDV